MQCTGSNLLTRLYINLLNFSLHLTNTDIRKNRNGKPWNLLQTCCGDPYTSFHVMDVLGLDHPEDIVPEGLGFINPHWEWESGHWDTHILINGELGPLYAKDTPAREEDLFT